MASLKFCPQSLEKKNTNFENDLKKILVEGSQDNHEKQLVEELTEEKGKNNTLAKKMKQLSQEFNELQRKNEDLERKIRQLEPGRSLADEFSEVNAKVATSTEAEYESRGIEASNHETTVPKTQDQGTNAGIDASSSTDQKKTKEEEARTNIPQNIMDWSIPIPNDKPEEQETPLEPTKVNTELSDPKSTPAEIPKKSTPSKG